MSGAVGVQLLVMLAVFIGLPLLLGGVALGYWQTRDRRRRALERFARDRLEGGKVVEVGSFASGRTYVARYEGRWRGVSLEIGERLLPGTALSQLTLRTKLEHTRAQFSIAPTDWLGRAARNLGFTPYMNLGDAELDQRYTVSGRERERVQALVRGGLGALLDEAFVDLGARALVVEGETLDLVFPETGPEPFAEVDVLARRVDLLARLAAACDRRALPAEPGRPLRLVWRGVQSSAARSGEGVSAASVQVTPREGARCPYCHDDLDVAEAEPCPGCSTLHHRECLDEAGGCTVLGCERSGRARSSSPSVRA